jgi:hypothetical protein
MAENKWIPRTAAIELLMEQHNVGIGKAQAALKAAHKSGEVRFYRDRFTDPTLPLPAGNEFIDGLDLPPGTILVSKADLLDWSDRQTRQTRQTPQVPATATATAPRPRDKRDRANTAIHALWPDGIPDRTILPNGKLCQRVTEWLKDDCRQRRVPLILPSDDTILRAAGRK